MARLQGSTTVSSAIVQSTTAESGEVDEFVAAIRFHRKLSFFSETAQKQLRVTYATVGSQVKDAPTILFAGGIYGGRYNGLWIDYLCATKGVRVILIDRPGIGGSTAVPLAQRVQVWLETVPALLAHLGLKEVSLASHSSGIIYLLNTLYRMPEILSAERPTIYVISPWVHPSKSGARMLTIASAMPAGLVSGWNKVSSFLVNSIMPSASTFELASKKAKKDQKQKGKKDQKAQEGWQEKEDVLLATTGLTAAEKEDTRNYFVKMFFAEETGGVSDEAKLGLKTYGEGQWGVCEDYQKYIPRLVEQLHKERKTKAQLRIMSYFGTNDGYVGKAGFKYFSDCWTAPETSGVLAYTGHEIPRMNHDDLTLPENGILGLMFDDALLTHKGGRTLS